MTGVVFMNTLRRNWRQGLYWGIGIAFLGIYIIIVVPNVDMLKQYANLIKTMPPLLMQAFGVSDAAEIATPAGFLGFGFFSYVSLVMAAYAVIAGLNVTANEEDRGIMDITLSLPIPRWRLVLERFLGYSVLIVIILAITFLSMWVTIQATNGLSFDVGKIFQGVLNLLPSALLVLAFTVLVGTALRSRGAAAALAAAFVIISYFVDFIGKSASGTAAASLRVISYFSYYNGGDIMRTGLVWSNVILLLVVAALMIAGGLWFFERRDIGV